jgi:hypothetical protein
LVPAAVKPAGRETQVIKVLLVVIGLTMLFMSLRQMFLTLRDGFLRARGNRLIKRKRHPIMFWFNFGGLVVVGILGVASIAWALLISN